MPEPKPIFDAPPVVETVLGVQFPRLNAVSSGHLGWFWKKHLGAEWTRAVDAPPLVPEAETFGAPAWVPAGLQLRLGHLETPARLQVINEAGNRMIQVQSNRFHLNWQKTDGDAYPTYHAILPEFIKQLEAFRRFVADERLGEVTPNQWEITYVDYVPPGDLWRSPTEWHRVLPALFGFGSFPESLRTENVGAEWHFEIAPRRGRLHLNVSLGKAGEREPGLLLQWTARGPIDKGAGVDVQGGLDLGHAATIETFLAVTSEEAHRKWGRRP